MKIENERKSRKHNKIKQNWNRMKTYKMEQDVNWDLGRTYKIATLFEEY